MNNGVIELLSAKSPNKKNALYLHLLSSADMNSNKPHILHYQSNIPFNWLFDSLYLKLE